MTCVGELIHKEFETTRVLRGTPNHFSTNKQKILLIILRLRFGRPDPTRVSTRKNCSRIHCGHDDQTPGMNLVVPNWAGTRRV